MPPVLRVHDSARRGAVIPDSPLESVDDERGVLLRVDRPADDSPTIGVEDGGAVDPAFARAVLRDVRDPEFVRSGGRRTSGSRDHRP